MLFRSLEMFGRFSRSLILSPSPSSSFVSLLSSPLPSSALPRASQFFSSTANVLATPAGRVRPLYLDMQATTPLDPRVLDAMLPLEVERYGNAHSRTHAYGWESEEYVEHAREQVASLISAQSKEIIFTSGATESNNLAIKGVARFYKEKKKHLVTTQIEHKCVLDSCRQLQQEGYDVHTSFSLTQLVFLSSFSFLFSLSSRRSLTSLFKPMAL